MVHVFWGSELHGTHHWPPAFKRALGTDHFGCQKGRPQCHGVKIKTISSRQKVASYGHNMPQYDIQIVESHLSHLSHLSFVMFLIPACACTAQGSLDMLLSKASLASGASFLRGFTHGTRDAVGSVGVSNEPKMRPSISQLNLRY